jgi:hypothetical protein
MEILLTCTWCTFLHQVAVESVLQLLDLHTQNIQALWKVTQKYDSSV